MTTNAGSRATADRYELHDKGTNHWLAIGPRYAKPMTDDLVVSVRHRYANGSSVLMSRAQVKDLHDFLGAWLESGWPGVPREEGPTPADIIQHYQRIAIRYQVERDHDRTDAARRIDAALTLIPTDRRDIDLDRVAKAQGELWARMQNGLDALEQARLGFVCALHEMAQAKNATADQLRAAAEKVASKYAHPKPKPLPEPAPEAPIYDAVQLGLFDVEVTA